jgi:cardiolipin synthase
MFLEDLQNSTEIVLADTHSPKRKPRRQRMRGKGAGSVRKATASAINAATSLGAIITKQAPLGAAEAKLLFLAGAALLVIALLLIFFPRIASIPLVIILLLLALPTLQKALRNYRNH